MNRLRWINSKNARVSEKATKFLPLPKGEGRGEGEGDVIISNVSETLWGPSDSGPFPEIYIGNHSM